MVQNLVLQDSYVHEQTRRLIEVMQELERLRTALAQGRLGDQRLTLMWQDVAEQVGQSAHFRSEQVFELAQMFVQGIDFFQSADELQRLHLSRQLQKRPIMMSAG